MKNKVHVNIFFISIWVFFLSSCSTSVKKEIPELDTEKMDLIEYGMNIQSITALLEHTGKPLFIFISNKNKYFITLYKPSLDSLLYLFMYENEKLISITLLNEGLSIWRNSFIKLGNNIPLSEHFIDIVKEFKNKKLSLEYSFLEPEIRSYRTFSNIQKTQGVMVSAPISIVLISGVGLPVYFATLFGLSLVDIDENNMHSNEKQDITSKTLNKIDSQNFLNELELYNYSDTSEYTNMLGEWSDLPLNSSYDFIKKNKGKEYF